LGEGKRQKAEGRKLSAEGGRQKAGAKKHARLIFDRRLLAKCLWFGALRCLQLHQEQNDFSPMIGLNDACIYKPVVPNGLFNFRFAVRLLPGTRLQLPTDEHQRDSRLRHVTEMWFDARSQDFA